MILNNEKQSKEELTVEDNIADVMNMEPDIFMAEAITVLSVQPLATIYCMLLLLFMYICI